MRRRPVVTILMLIIAVILPLPMRAQQKPFTQEQASNMVRAGLGDDSGAKLIEQRGIDFAPAEDLLQNLKAAGASEAFLKALRSAKPPEPASAKKPLNQVQVFALLAGGVPSHRVTMLVQERGIDFEPTDDYLQEVRLAGGEDELISALKSAKVTKPATVDPAAQARQAEVRQHVARGLEFLRGKRYADAEVEFRAAVRLDPQDAELHVALGVALGSRGDWDGEIAEQRQALRLNPNNDRAHFSLSFALGQKGDWDGDIAEEREALRLDPNSDSAHAALGIALGKKGDWDGLVAEEREGVRLNPNNDMAHAALGAALEKKGDRRRALEEYRAAYTLDPKNADVKRAYERLSQPSSPLPNAVPGAALFVAYRTSRHQQYSTPEVFGNIADQIALFLKSHNVALLNDATGRNISTESAPSVYNLVSQVRSAGGGSLILLTVDRPETSWVKLQVQCYDTSGQLLWEESTADSGWGHRGAAGVRNAIEKMEERLALRLGQAGMPTK